MEVTVEHNRRASDTLIIELNFKVDQILEDNRKHHSWMEDHERRIQDCEKQHVRIKTIIALAGGIITMLWAGVVYYIFDMKPKH